MYTERAVEAFLKHQRVRGFKATTLRRRRWSLGAWITHLDGVSLGEATIDDVEDFLARFESVQTRHSVGSDLRLFYAWAVDRGLLVADPTVKLGRSRVPTRAATPISTEDVLRLIQLTSGATRVAVMLAAFAGLRVSEIGRLRGEDVRIDVRALVVRNGKGGKDAVVPLADELAHELAWWPRTGPVLGIRGDSVSRRIRRAMRRLGIEGRPHDLRHSFGTMAAVRTNGNLVLVAQLMRHEQVQTTQRYVGWAPNGHEVVTGLYGPAA